MKTPFLGPSAYARSPNAQADRSVNIYPEMTPQGRDVAVFYGTPGMLEWVDLTGRVRGLHVAGAYLYAVAGANIVKVSSGGTETVLGTLSTSSGAVQMADNGAELLIVDGTAGRIVTLATGVVAAIADTDFIQTATSCTFQDGYFIVNEPGTQAFYQSDLYDGTSWDALNFASKEGGPDNLVTLLSDHRELWLFGKETTEVWYNAGTSTFAFARVDGAFSEVGCAAEHSPAKLDNSVFWLGNDGMVYRANGYTPARVSNSAVEHAIEQMTTVSDAYSWTYKQEGHAFYCLTFPTAGQTWCFDTSSQMWHERASLVNGEFTAHPATCCVQFGKMILVGDSTGKVSKLDLATYSDNGNPIKRLRRWAHLNNSGKVFTIPSLQLHAETGVGLDGSVAEPLAMLRWSDDGGHTWSNEHTASMGAIGEYKARATWRRLGSSRDRTFEVSMTDPVKCAWIGAEIL